MQDKMFLRKAAGGIAEVARASAAQKANSED
jgi:hypothetical protein